MLEDKNNKEEIDFSGALKDSDKGVNFQDERQQSVQVFLPGTPKVVQWAIKYSGGLVKNEKQANYVLIGFAALAIIISLFLFFGGGSGKSGKNEEKFLPPPEIPSEY